MNNVLQLRTSRLMTQEAFAELCNVSRITIARAELGKDLSFPTANKIAKACNVSVSYVMGDNLAPETAQPAEPAEPKKWDVEYPAGTLLRTATPAPTQPAPFTQQDIPEIARLVQAYISTLTPAEQEILEDYRLLTANEKHRVRMLIAEILDSRYLSKEKR